MEIKEKYLLHLEIKLSESTLREYRRMLNLFYEEAKEHPLIPIRSQSEYEEIIKTIAARFNWSPGTRYRMSILIEDFGKFAYRERVIDRIPYENEFKKGNGKRVEFFTEDEFYRTAFNPFHSISDFVMMILFWDCGMRKSELINLNLGDVDIQDGMIRIINIKTGKIRYNPITPFCRSILSLYLLSLGFQGKLKSMSDPLFYSPTWTRLNESTLHRHMKMFEDNVPNIKVFAHKFRHSLGGRIVSRGGDLSLVKELLGHENLNTTMIYTHFAKDKLREMYNKFANSVESVK